MKKPKKTPKCSQCANPMLKGLHTCSKKKSKKKVASCYANEDGEDFFAKLADEAGDDDIRLNRDDMKISDVMTAVENELRRAVNLHGGMKSCHEGYAVILEEVDELWEHVRLKDKLRKKSEMRLEAIQIAAMAARFVVDLC